MYKENLSENTFHEALCIPKIIITCTSRFMWLIQERKKVNGRKNFIVKENDRTTGNKAKKGARLWWLPVLEYCCIFWCFSITINTLADSRSDGILKMLHKHIKNKYTANDWHIEWKSCIRNVRAESWDLIFFQHTWQPDRYKNSL